MFYRVGRYYNVFNREKEVSGRYKLLENHNDFLVFHGMNGMTIQKDTIVEDGINSTALEKANENDLLWVVEPVDPQTPPRKTPRMHSRKYKKRRSKKVRR
jgi:hypothetical protein